MDENNIIYINDNNKKQYINVQYFDLNILNTLESCDDQDIIDKKFNIFEFLESINNKNILPRTKYDYNTKNEIIWWWHDVNNKKPIEMTVALPALNSEKIIWLALESLKNQTNINFVWELICLEEYGKSREIIQSYANRLPGCVRIIHRSINPITDGFYENLNKFTLAEKWIAISKYADSNSRIFVKHAADDYSPPKRLYIHYEHFKYKNCYYSTQPRGYFYNILDDKYALFNGRTKEKFSDHLTMNHLNMALKTSVMRKIPVPSKPLFRAIDSYIFSMIVKLKSKDPKKEKIIFADTEIDTENWKHGLFTDGYNIISIHRHKTYVKSIHHSFSCLKNKPKDLKIPQYIFDRLRSLAN